MVFHQHRLPILSQAQIQASCAADKMTILKDMVQFKVEEAQRLKDGGLPRVDDDAPRQLPALRSLRKCLSLKSRRIELDGRQHVCPHRLPPCFVSWQ